MRQAIIIAVAMGLLFGMLGCTETATKAKAPEAAKAPDAAKAPEAAKTTTAKAVEKAKAPEAAKTTTAKAVEKATPSGKLAIRVDCGSDKVYTDLDGNKWMADQVYAEGKKWGASGGQVVTRTIPPIAGTRCPGIYLTERYEADSYRFDVPNGKYTVRVHVAETWEGVMSAGERVFTVKIQGKPVFVNVDPFKDGGGFAKPVVKEAKGVDVTDGKLMIEFVPSTDHTAPLNGIEVLAE